MKVKIFLSVIISIFLLLNFIIASEPPEVVGQEDYERLQEGIDTYSPVDNSGKVDLDGYKPFVTKAEERIGNINSWLEENAMWLSIVFGMVPAVSFHFFANLYIIFFLIVFLVLNSKYTVGMIPGLEKKISSSDFTYSKLTGIVILVLLMVTKVTVVLGKIVSEFILYVWNVIIPTSIIIAIVAVVILIVLMIFIPGFASSLFQIISKLIVQDVEKKAMSDMESDKAALHKIVEEATKD